jgi:hypothetical protein
VTGLFSQFRNRVYNLGILHTGNLKQSPLPINQLHVIMVALTDYERERQERIGRNKQILASLGVTSAKADLTKELCKSPGKSPNKKRHGFPVSSQENLPARRTSARIKELVVAHTLKLIFGPS